MGRRSKGNVDLIGATLVGQYDLQRQDDPTEAGYTIILYDWWEGDVDPDDPAATVERRVAYFLQETAPALGFDIVEAVRNGNEDYWSYKGLKGAILDHSLLMVHEADREAENFREQSESVNQDPNAIEDGYYNRNLKSDAEAYEKFWKDVETLLTDPENQEANDSIRAFREQRHEAVYRKGKSGY
jgi:hypothetical protein